MASFTPKSPHRPPSQPESEGIPSDGLGTRNLSPNLPLGPPAVGNLRARGSIFRQAKAGHPFPGMLSQAQLGPVQRRKQSPSLSLVGGSPKDPAHPVIIALLSLLLSWLFPVHTLL